MPELLDWFESGFLTLMVYAAQEDTRPDITLTKLHTKELRAMEGEHEHSLRFQRCTLSFLIIMSMNCMDHRSILVTANEFFRKQSSFVATGPKNRGPLLDDRVVMRLRNREAAIIRIIKVCEYLLNSCALADVRLDLFRTLKGSHGMSRLMMH